MILEFMFSFRMIFPSVTATDYTYNHPPQKKKLVKRTKKIKTLETLKTSSYNFNWVPKTSWMIPYTPAISTPSFPTWEQP